MFGFNKKEDNKDHIVVPREETPVIQKGPDLYREPIDSEDLEGIAPAKKEVAGMTTPLQEISQGWGVDTENISPKTETSNQFVVEEVAPAIPVQEVPVTQNQEPNLEDLKRREAELEAHFANKSEIEIQKEQKADLIQKAENAFEQGKSPITFNKMIDGIEQDIRSLERSAALASQEEFLDQQVGSVDQERQSPPVQVAPPVSLETVKIPGVGNTSGLPLPGYQPILDQQEGYSVSQEGQPVGEVKTQTESLVLQSEKITPEVARDVFDRVFRDARVAQTQSFDELYQIMEQVTEFTSSTGGVYALDELKNLIEMVRSGNAAVNVITRTGGLRNKVVQLMSKEMNQKQESFEQVA